MLVKNVIAELEKYAPLSYAEDFDNVGLLVGDENQPLTKILVTLDVTEEVLDEAITRGVNLIVSFHPIIFSGLKKLKGNTYVERIVMKAIRNNINIYAIHTALDNAELGVNYQIAQQLELINTTILIPKKDTLKQLITYAPKQISEKVRNALLEAGAGSIGNYDYCSFNINGIGTFRANKNANPTIGKIGNIEHEEEIRISVIYEKHIEQNILRALRENHTYEEIAYEILNLSNTNQTKGIGRIGELKTAMNSKDFFDYVKEKMNVTHIRHSKINKEKIKRVAVLGGSGSFAIPHAKQQKADVYLTADLKYHDFFTADDQIILADIGHYESEQHTKKLLTAFLSKKFLNFAVLNSKINTNPVNYY